MDKGAPQQRRVVVHRNGKTERGFLSDSRWQNLEEILRSPSIGFPDFLPLTRDGSSETVEIPVSQAKAVFFVKSFEGCREQLTVHFHSDDGVAGGLWVRVRFKDGEIVEGIVYNSSRYLVDPGFFLRPSDPESNNELIYILKSAIDEFQVIGVREIG